MFRNVPCSGFSRRLLKTGVDGKQMSSEIRPAMQGTKKRKEESGDIIGVPDYGSWKNVKDMGTVTIR